jgi:hypothetical protein
MGLTNKLVQMFGIGAIIEVIREKDPASLALIDGLDECNGAECIARMIHARSVLSKSLPTRPIKINERQIDWSKYIERFLTETPALAVVSDILREFGVTEVAGVNVDEALQALASYGDK